RWRGPMEGGAFLEFLLALQRDQGLRAWILLPCQDDGVAFVARHGRELAPAYRLATPDWGTVRWALDKPPTHRNGAGLGIPAPRTRYPGGEDELATLDLAYPVIVKPAISIRLQHALRLKALPARDAEELRAQYRVARAALGADEIMVQQIIPGGGEAQYSVA